MKKPKKSKNKKVVKKFGSPLPSIKYTIETMNFSVGSETLEGCLNLFDAYTQSQKPKEESNAIIDRNEQQAQEELENEYENCWSENTATSREGNPHETGDEDPESDEDYLDN